MISITQSGQINSLIAQMRDLPARVVPLATAKALTFTAQAAQKDIIAAMRTAFDRPTAYTLNATRVVPATQETLSARVAVKDVSNTGGNLPENYLFPGVYAGPRKLKRFEKALRYAGALTSGQAAITSVSAARDAFGNLKRAELNAVLSMVDTAVAASKGKTTGKRRKTSATAGGYFVAGLSKKASTLQPGIYKRQSSGASRWLRPVLIFTDKTPTYRTRLDFEAIAKTAAQREMPAAFARAWAATLKNAPQA
jgi:hypothetical protein